jgi:hypothetical protein
MNMPVKVGLKHIEIWNDTLENTVLRYEEEPIVEDQIVFYGPSNFTRWAPKYGMRPLREDILGASGAPCVINRGFGSSCTEHQLYYYDRLVRPLKPRVLVYSPGFGNGKAFGYTLEEIWELAQRVILYAKTDFPALRIYLCGAQRKRDETEEHLKDVAWFDERLREFAEEIPDCTYVDVMGYQPLNREDIYVKDGVHYSQEGYDIYGAFFRDVLKNELEQY